MRTFVYSAKRPRTISDHENMDHKVSPGCTLYEREAPADLDPGFTSRLLVPHIPVALTQDPAERPFFVPADDLAVVQP